MKIIKDLPYAQYGDRVMLLDLYLPAAPTSLVPAILCVVGGGWRSTAKEGYVEAGTGLAQAGYVAAAITYRSSTDTIAPGNVHDCKAAVRWLRANAAKYGIDSTRIGALGGSAGAHLVSLLGTTNGQQELEGNGGNPAQSSAVQAVCEFCAPIDLTLGAQPELRKKYSVLYECVEAYIGGPVEKHMDLAKLVSPLRYISHVSAPTLIIHGDMDDIVSVEESIVFYSALKEAGVDATLHIAKGATHDLKWETYGDQVVAFFRRTLTNKKERD